MCGAAKVAD
uniref:Uncharacterized protein n=1 Tax=Moniliophthora roreri TaxID=221103 RepID=A0A0W0FXG7_MONRR